MSAVITLIIPHEKYLESYIEAFDEYRAHNVTTYALTAPRACDIFEKYDNYRHARNLKPDRVGADFYWLVDDEKDYFIGEITIRHRLTDALRLRGGHIGYCIRYSEWNKGYGTMLLRLGLEKARKRGLEKVLITCNDDNYGSAKVMENNGFVLADKVECIVASRTVLTRRYWKDIREEP